MKRSEMIELLKSKIASTLGNDGEVLLLPAEDYLARVVLSAVEEAGMRPPQYNDKNSGINVDFLKQAWENE